MKPHISVITIGVNDLEKSVEFYRDLGLRTDGIVGKEFEHGAVAFFELQSGLKLALWPRISIALDTGVDEQSPNPTEFTFGHNVNSTTEVDDIMINAEAAGAKVIKPGASTFWGGYSGYVADPDGHLWELAHNPFFPLDAAGNVTLAG